MEFRLLKADEIDCRVQSIKENGLALLLYKDARCDMKILDETLGAEYWQREHYSQKNTLFCRVGIWNKELLQWVWKSDAGKESNTEAVKGESSDSFKRACFNWGIGRELYTSPFIWVKAKDCDIRGTKCYDNFVVTDIDYDNNNKITKLVIYNMSKKCEAFRMGKAVKKTAEPQKVENERTKLIEYLSLTGIEMGDVAKTYKLNANTTQERFKEVLEDLINGK